MRKNHALAAIVLSAILDGTARWDQAYYATCFAGLALKEQGYTFKRVDTGLTPVFVVDDPSGNRVDNAMQEARAELGFTAAQARNVFLFFPAHESYADGSAFRELESRVLAALEDDDDTDFSGV